MMKTLTAQEIKTALESGKAIFEGANIEWNLKDGARHYYKDGVISDFDWCFIESARTPEYLANHLCNRQQLFGAAFIIDNI